MTSVSSSVVVAASTGSKNTLFLIGPIVTPLVAPFA
jgi:hypothetical protein